MTPDRSFPAPKLAQIQDRQALFQEYLQQEQGHDADKLAFLDRGIDRSPLANQIKQYPSRLAQPIDGQTAVSLGPSAVVAGTSAAVSFSPYPKRGVLPQLDAAALNFLHRDIQQACLCVGSLVDGKMQTRWLGKNPLEPAQLWSTTKILPLLNVVCRANAVLPSATMHDCVVRSPGEAEGYSFYQLAVDLVSYQSAIASSNAVAATFKQFETPDRLERWLKNITGNSNLEFRGRYGELPFISAPDLWSQPLKRVLLTTPSPEHTGNNLLSTYDLTRCLSMLGWHHHLALESRLPAAQWSSLETVVRALGTDTARYVDVALDRLGLMEAIEAPVVLSKLGFGRSDIRNRTELAYAALVQFVDLRPRAQGKPGILRTVAMALLGAKALDDAHEEARQLDARMATEVTEILRRIVTQELV